MFPFCKQCGFTLIELIVSIIIVSILGVGVVNFIGRTTQGYADLASRQQLATIGWIVSEKTSREIRDALPNSFRLNGGSSCIEFIPTVAGTDYVSVPTISAQSSFEVINFANYTTPGSAHRIAVYPNSITDMYDRSVSPNTISSTIDSIGAGSEADSRTVTLDSAHQFITDSPTRRLYVTQDPVMYCYIGSLLNRYEGYGYYTAIPDPIAESLTGVVVGNQMSGGSFSYSAGTLTRTGVVSFAFDIVADSGETQSISQEVQIRNVP